MPYISVSLRAERALSDEKCCQRNRTIQCSVVHSVLVNTVAFTTFRGHLTNSMGFVNVPTSLVIVMECIMLWLNKADKCAF